MDGIPEMNFHLFQNLWLHSVKLVKKHASAVRFCVSATRRRRFLSADKPARTQI